MARDRLLHRGDGRALLPSRPRDLEPAADARFSTVRNAAALSVFESGRDSGVPGGSLRARRGDDRMGEMMETRKLDASFRPVRSRTSGTKLRFEMKLVNPATGASTRIIVVGAGLAGAAASAHARAARIPRALLLVP